MRISVDSELCQGHGRCYELAESLVTDDDRGHAVIVKADVPPELEDEARAAFNACPESAISLGD